MKKEGPFRPEQPSTTQIENEPARPRSRETLAALEAENEREQMERVSAVKNRLAPKTRGGDKPDVMGDLKNARKMKNGQLALTSEEYVVLNQETDTFFESVKDSKVATSTGYKVAGAYDTKVQGWTTQSKIIEVEGKRMFALCSYPASKTRRLTDRFMEWVSGDTMRKPKPKDWKSIVEARSNIPTVAGTPENMVLMPYIESMNAYDLFARQKEIKNFGPFDWAEKMTVEDKLALLPTFARTLKDTHDQGKTWGEAILPNLVLTKEKQPILIDPETTYEGIPLLEQKATDIRNLISSISGALAHAEGVTDFELIVKGVLAGYPNKKVIETLKAICAKPVPWRQRLTFNIFNKFRLGAADLNQFEQVKQTIVRVIAQLGA